MALVTQIGAVNPAGTGASIPVGITGSARVGDVVLAAFAWSGHQLGAVVDSSGNAWTTYAMNNGTSVGGGLAWSVLTSGWATTTITGSVDAGIPGGRCGWVGRISATQLSGTPFDQHVAGTPVTTQTPLTSTGTLATTSSLIFGVLISLAVGGSASMSWGNSFTGDGAVNAAATSNGLFVAELQASSAAAVAATGTTRGPTDSHVLDVIAFKLVGGSSPATSPTITVDRGYGGRTIS